MVHVKVAKEQRWLVIAWTIWACFNNSLVLTNPMDEGRHLAISSVVELNLGSQKKKKLVSFVGR